MNDRLKYRAWHKPTKRMFEVWSFTPEYVYEHDEVNGIGSPTNPARLEDCELIQCTGLTDKNGKLIYEGDIVKLDILDVDEENWLDIGVIDWDKSQYQVERCFSTMRYLPMPLKYVPVREIETKMFVEVIGNVHKNPELLEGK